MAADGAAYCRDRDAAAADVEADRRNGDSTNRTSLLLAFSLVQEVFIRGYSDRRLSGTRKLDKGSGSKMTSADINSFQGSSLVLLFDSRQGHQSRSDSLFE